MRIVKGIYFWMMSISMTLTFWALCGLAHLRVVLLGLPRDGRPVHRVASAWGRTVIRLVPGWHLSISGREHLIPDGQASVIVANHESMADILAMYYLGVQFRWLSKAEVFKLPFVGQAMRWAGYVPVDRRSRESGAEAMRASADRLAKGLAMFYFPEGTRSADGAIKPFKLGAFKLAQGCRAPIQPIAIHGAGELLRKGSMFPSDRAHVQIAVLPSIPPPAAGENLDDYAESVRRKLIVARDELVRASGSTG